MMLDELSPPRGSAKMAVQLELLESFRLSVHGVELRVPEGTQRLVALLALRDRPLRRCHVAGTLWPDKTEARAAANLRSSLWRLHASCPSVEVVSCSGSCLHLARAVSVDAAVLERLGWSLLEGPVSLGSREEHDRVTAPSATAGDCLELFSRELLPGWYEEWVAVERERLGQLQLRFLEALVHACLARGDSARAVDTAMRLVARDALREPSQHALVQALVAEGSWGRAGTVVAEYCRLVDEVFGSGTSASFATAYPALAPAARLAATHSR